MTFYKFQILVERVKFLSFAKVYNLFVNLLSFILSLFLNTTIKKGLPVSLSIEPINFCNLKCPECPVGLDSSHRTKGQIELSLYKKIIDEVKNHLISLNLYFQGEPFLNHNIFEMVNYAANRGIYTIISTNAQLINIDLSKKIVDSSLNELIISLDGATADTYQKYRKGGDFPKVLDALTFIMNEKKAKGGIFPIIKLQFLVFKYNEHEIDLIKEIGKEIGVYQTIIKTAQIYNYQNKASLIPTKRKHSRYLIKEGNVVKKNKIHNYCWHLWTKNVITINGNLLPCCFDKYDQYVLGNLKTESLSSIIKGDNYKNFSNQVLHNRKKIDICCNCN